MRSNWRRRERESVNIRMSEKRGYVLARTGHGQVRRRQTDHQARSKAKPAGLAMKENTCEANGSQVKMPAHCARQEAVQRDKHRHCLHDHCLSLLWLKSLHQWRILTRPSKMKYPHCQPGLPNHSKSRTRATQCRSTTRPTPRHHHPSGAATDLYQPLNPKNTNHTAHRSNDKTG